MVCNVWTNFLVLFPVLFGNIELIKSLNEELHKELKGSQVSLAFKRFAPMLKIYSAYARNYQQAIETLQVKKDYGIECLLLITIFDLKYNGSFADFNFFSSTFTCSQFFLQILLLKRQRQSKLRKMRLGKSLPRSSLHPFSEFRATSFCSSSSFLLQKEKRIQNSEVKISKTKNWKYMLNAHSYMLYLPLVIVNYKCVKINNYQQLFKNPAIHINGA